MKTRHFIGGLLIGFSIGMATILVYNQTFKRGDINHDRTVNLVDVSLLISDWPK